MTLTRLTSPVHWHRRLDDAIDAIRLKPFSYGSHDCALGLVAAVVEAVTGEDLASQFRGAYTDRGSALALIKAGGFSNLGDMVASLLPEIPEGIAHAHIGDVAAIPDDGPFGYSLGIVNGERIFVLMPKGLGTVDLLKATRAFKVG